VFSLLVRFQEINKRRDILGSIYETYSICKVSQRLIHFLTACVGELPTGFLGFYRFEYRCQEDYSNCMIVGKNEYLSVEKLVKAKGLDAWLDEEV
jgi:hypothetical protein